MTCDEVCRLRKDLFGALVLQDIAFFDEAEHSSDASMLALQSSCLPKHVFDCVIKNYRNMKVNSKAMITEGKMLKSSALNF